MTQQDLLGTTMARELEETGIRGNGGMVEVFGLWIGGWESYEVSHRGVGNTNLGKGSTKDDSSTIDWKGNICSCKTTSCDIKNCFVCKS